MLKPFSLPTRWAMKLSGNPSTDATITFSIFDSSNDSKSGTFDTTHKGKKYYTTKNRLIDTNHSIIQSVFTIMKGESTMKTMTENEKKLLQAQHRLEEAQARDRVKERKARTRRLIQEGAILEKVLPEVRTIELSELEGYLSQKLGNQT